MTPDQEYVMRTIESRDVHFVRFWFTDVMGNLKSFAVSPGELADAFSYGMGFDGSCIAGFTGAAESDMLAFPDAGTFQILPWRPDSNAVARMFCSIRTPEGDVFEGDSRAILARVVEQVRQRGFLVNIGPELEYFYFCDSTAPVVLDRGGYFDLTQLDSGSDLRRDTVLTLERMGIPVEYSHHESGQSQHEVDLRYSDACSMADAVMTYKMVVKEVAAKHGVYASFMPKPLSDQPGSGMHLHVSLFTPDDHNAFWDEQAEADYHLSHLAKCFIAGLLHYAPEYSLVTNQYVNSYKRLTGGADSPSYISWGRSNRSTLIRIPGYKPHKENACRIELRNPDPACNPYLAIAAVLAAGLAGIDEELEAPAPVDGHNLALHTSAQLEQAGIAQMPRTLAEAVDAFAQSRLMQRVLGEHIHSYLVQAKRAEYRAYQATVSPWELDHYLEVL
ncbi:L-glutamine synthetase [Cryptobacterium curtum DSM 15641]|uniref:L-glutamine synthetase n=1 Tax=Cryptobacterium curtum (strain ATCC 700683 / DSM 15641 / CCUG 43107 / 12-3) TaxID=469378 RepID=C7MNN7_CRYCD|nr:glutamine synthetase family protein [Cryptobacterium curtum]ACU94527.1 L-glutamine synthetase [Cryptobacterium curtum DSM 15641]